MGTTKSGRYFKTQGSGTTVGDYALVHSSEGTFTRPSRPGTNIRLLSGGHGQHSLNLLDKYGIKYNIVKEYENGVRVGNIPTHKDKRKRIGTGQAWFPKNWSDKDIRRAGDHVASLKENRHAPDGKVLWGVYKGVRVGIIKTKGTPGTVFPDSDQSSVINKKNKNKNKRRKKK